MTALFNAVQDYFKREGTLKKPDPIEANDGIGIERPIFDNARNAISCSDEHCFKTFGLINRGHNCKACGKVYFRYSDSYMAIVFSSVLNYSK